MESAKRTVDAVAVYPRLQPGETFPRDIEIFGRINFRDKDSPPNYDDCARLARSYSAGGFTAYTDGSRIDFEREVHLCCENDLLEEKIAEYFGYQLMHIRYHS